MSMNDTDDLKQTETAQKKPVIQFVSDDESEKDAELIETETEGEELSEAEEPEKMPVSDRNGIDRLNAHLSSFFRPGTPTCAMFGAVCGVGAAVLCLTIGFWPTLLLGGCVGIGAWIGGSGKGTFWDRFRKIFKK